MGTSLSEHFLKLIDKVKTKENYFIKNIPAIYLIWGACCLFKSVQHLGLVLIKKQIYFLFLHRVSHQTLTRTFSQPALGLLVLIIIKCLKRILYKNNITFIAKSLLSTQIYMSYNLNFLFYNVDFYQNLLWVSVIHYNGDSGIFSFASSHC